jgi:anti-sigma factor RsiW
MRHYGEELQDLLDGRLAEPQRAEIEAHVAACERCRRELDALRWVKTQMPRELRDAEAPAELASRVRAALDAAPPAAKAPAVAGYWGSPRIRRHALIAGALAAAALLVVFLPGHEAEPLTIAVIDDFRAYDEGRERLDFESADPKAVEAYFARNGIDFPTHVYDLGMMNYRLAGGSVKRLDGRASAMFAYRDADNVAVVCQMYEGNVRDLPATDDVRQHNGFTFHVYRSGNTTLVFWQEDGIVCVLASDAPMETVVRLAFAKAMRPPGQA